jgi:hypothetical protein
MFLMAVFLLISGAKAVHSRTKVAMAYDPQINGA